jgi:phosphoglycolate phosphatase-like HAD superfamily hydrolase
MPQRPRLVLWDIDRTLIFAGGVDKAVWLEVCSQLSGRPVRQLGTTSGRTDPQILLDAFLLAGVDEAQARQLLPAALQLEAERLSGKLDELRVKGRAMPGAEAALQALQQQPGVVQSVLTGNVKANAMLKLKAFELDGYVDFDIGAYGSDHADRPKLVQLAQERAATTQGVRFDAATTVLIGDSPRDVEAGRVSGARVVAVATGRTSRTVLASAGADVVLADLSDTQAVLAAVLAESQGEPEQASAL